MHRVGYAFKVTFTGLKMERVEKKKALELKKHVAAIHSSNKLSLLQRKIANALLFNAYNELLEKDEHTIHIANLCKIIGYDSNDYKTIKRSLVNLLATVIEWNLIDGDRLAVDGGVWNASSIIADASIQGPICTYSYSNKMKQLLHRPELYGRINMAIQAQFQSTYGLALYENCVRFHRIKKTPWFDLATFRKLMGVEEQKYRIFRDFKNRVIEKALEEVNKYSPLQVTPQYKKQGRQVVAIQFIMVNKEEVCETIDPIAPQPAIIAPIFGSLSTLLKEQFQFNPTQIEEILSEYEESYIREKMQLVTESRSYKQGRIKHLAKYLICALKDNYQTTVTSIKVTPAITVAPVNKAITASEVDAYRRYQQRQLLALYDKQSKKVKAAILVEFEKNLGKSIYHDIYLRDGLKNILIQDQLCIFLNQKKSNFIEGKIATLDEFCASMREVLVQ